MAFILASGSPRRAELLRKMGISDFKTLSLDVDESCPSGLTAEQTVAFIARKKGDAAAKLAAPDDLVVTADTMVFLDNDRLGKPTDEDDALRMLTGLSDRCHTVCTGVTVRRGQQCEEFTVSTAVYFRACTESELRAYIATGEPMDKAGAYGIQGRACVFIEKIDGDYYNVMGFPVERLGRALKNFGISLF